MVREEMRSFLTDIDSWMPAARLYPQGGFSRREPSLSYSHIYSSLKLLSFFFKFPRIGRRPRERRQRD